MKILIVEDEIKLAQAVKRALELQKYTIDVVYDGTKGHDLASTQNYDLIILDIMLPGMSGIEVCSALRATDIHTPILMLTAKGQIRDKILGLDAGADDYMVKPFSLEELFSRIRALIRRSNKKSEGMLRVKNLTLNPITFRVKRDDKEIHLSTKEFSILEYLMRNKNKVLTKSKIVGNVWDYNSDVLTTTVEVHIKNLRDKIDKPFHNQLIYTVRGFGYEIRDKE